MEKLFKALDLCFIAMMALILAITILIGYQSRKLEKEIAWYENQIEQYESSIADMEIQVAANES